MDTAFYAARSRPTNDRGDNPRLSALEEENTRLKLLLAETLVENAAPKQERYGAVEPDGNPVGDPK